MDQALCAATEARVLWQRGDVVRAERVERTIDDLVGYWQDGKFRWPAAVLDALDASPTDRRRPAVQS